MLCLVTLLQILYAISSVQATPVPATAEARDSLEARQESFQCAKGYVLSSYTSSGISTCTRISGSAITPGYSAQTVAVVGLVSGLTGLLVTCLPAAKYFYRAGNGYFRPGRSPQWENAFPRDVIDNDSSVEHYQGDSIHDGWHSNYKKLQAEFYDPKSTFVINSDEKGSNASIYHNGLNINHVFNIVPHNSTHDKWQSHSEVTLQPNATGLARRDTGWTGARIEFEDYELDGRYNGVPINHDQAHEIAYEMMFGYVAGVYSGNNWECAFMGKTNPTPSTRFAGLVTILSQIDYSEYFLGAECPAYWTGGMDVHDELK